MATLADELLNDFEDSGSEDGGQHPEFLGDNDEDQTNGFTIKHERSGSTAGRDLDGDEEEMGDAEEELAVQNGAGRVADDGDEEDTKAKVEKMKLGGVNDVRNVAGLMKILQPVLEVRYPHGFFVSVLDKPRVYISCKAALTCPPRP